MEVSELFTFLHYKSYFNTYKAEVSCVQELPFFPVPEQESSANDVADDEKHAKPNRYRAKVSVVTIRIVIIAIEWVLIHHWCNVASLTMNCKTHRRHDARRWRWNFNFVTKQRHNDDGDRIKWKITKENKWLYNIAIEKKNYHQPMLDAMKCRMEQKIEGNCYGTRTEEEKEKKFKWKLLFPCQRIASMGGKNRENKNLDWKVVKIQSLLKLSAFSLYDCMQFNEKNIFKSHL